MTDKQRDRLKQLPTIVLLAAASAYGVPAAFAGDHYAKPATNTTPPNTACTLIVPPNPLSAAGLATPYRLTATNPANGSCNETNTAQSAFVQAAIIDPATGAISIYNPLVIDTGTKPAVAPVVPALPANAIVALWFGFNADELTLQAEANDTLADAHCVNGTRGSVFGQYAYCNAPAFFKVANHAIAKGHLHVPPLGTANDGQPCPTVRDFFVVDQDQSDNLPTTYLVTPKGLLAQNTASNAASLKGSITLGNPSDNGLTDVFLDGAMACKPFMAPDLANPGHMVPALALNELQARTEQATPVALVPGGDPMTESAGNEDRYKVNLYRRGVDQPTALSEFDMDTARYCRQLLRIAPARLARNQASFSKFSTPDANAANSLYTFMAQRFVTTYELLNCRTLIDIPDPVSVATNAAGVAVSAVINKTALNEAIKQRATTKSEDDNADTAAQSQTNID
jgi:hypothetical protein